MKVSQFYERILVPAAQIVTLFTRNVLPKDRESKVLGCHLQENLNHIAVWALSAKSTELDLVRGLLQDFFKAMNESVKALEPSMQANLLHALIHPELDTQSSFYKIRQGLWRKEQNNVLHALRLVGYINVRNTDSGPLTWKSFGEWLNAMLVCVPEKRRPLVTRGKNSYRLNRWRMFEHNFERQTAAALLGLRLDKPYVGKNYQLALELWTQVFGAQAEGTAVLEQEPAASDSIDSVPSFVRLDVTGTGSILVSATDDELVTASNMELIKKTFGPKSAAVKSAEALQAGITFSQETSPLQLVEALSQARAWYQSRREQLTKLNRMLAKGKKEAKMQSEAEALRSKFSAEELAELAKLLGKEQAPAAPAKPRTRTRKVATK